MTKQFVLYSQTHLPEMSLPYHCCTFYWRGGKATSFLTELTIPPLPHVHTHRVYPTAKKVGKRGKSNLHLQTPDQLGLPGARIVLGPLYLDQKMLAVEYLHIKGKIQYWHTIRIYHSHAHILLWQGTQTSAKDSAKVLQTPTGLRLEFPILIQTGVFWACTKDCKYSYTHHQKH